jgi:hypothetical protein
MDGPFERPPFFFSKEHGAGSGTQAELEGEDLDCAPRDGDNRVALFRSA